MTTVSDLSDNLVGEIFSKVPITSLSAVRCTCKKWNALSKVQILGEKTARSNQFLEFMIMDSKVFTLRFDLQRIRNEEDYDDFVDLSVKQISIPNNNDQIEISQVYHCDDLLLCIPKDNSRLFVWNPYLGQTKLIQPRNEFHKYVWFALGYDKNRNHKILRFYKDYEKDCVDVYDFSSDTWRVIDVNPNCSDLSYHSGVSLKGNTYFFGQEVTTEESEVMTPTEGELVTDIKDFLLCFDFTSESFGPRLCLPFDPPPLIYDYLTLSWVRDEKLAVFYTLYDTLEIIHIWISTKIEPNAVSWGTFLTLDMTLINGLPNVFSRLFQASSFFIDEEKQVAVLIDIDRYRWTETCSYQIACIVGDGGYFKSVDMGVTSDSRREPGKLVGSSYVPSLAQLQV